MTAREKRLSIGVAGVAALIVNFLLIEFFFKHDRLLRDEAARKTTELRTQQMLFEEQDLWEKRSAWVQSIQPKLTKESSAGDVLMKEVKEVATKHSVLIEAPAYNNLKKEPEYASVSVDFETKGSWQALCAFLKEIQGPDRFLVFERAFLQVDDSDKTQMRGKFRLAKWFARQ